MKLTQWQSYVTYSCKRISTNASYISWPISVKFTTWDPHIRLLSICKFWETHCSGSHTFLTGTNETTQQFKSKECLGTTWALHCRVIRKQSCVLYYHLHLGYTKLCQLTSKHHLCIILCHCLLQNPTAHKPQSNNVMQKILYCLVVKYFLS